MTFQEPDYLWLIVGALLAGLIQFRLSFREVNLFHASASALLTCMSLALLAASLATPVKEERHLEYEVNALIDISDSMDVSVAEGLLTKLKSYQLAGSKIWVRPFSKEVAPFAVPLDELGSFQTLRDRWGKLNVGASNLEQALSGTQGPTLLISDGFETEGDSLRALARARAEHTLLFPLVPSNSIAENAQFALSHLYAPLTAPAQKSVEIRATVVNNTAQARDGVLEILHDAKVVFNGKVSVPAGQEKLIKAQSDPSQEGIKAITARFTPTEGFDPSIERVFLSGQQRERVLLLSGQDEDQRLLRQVLEQQAYQLNAYTAENGSPPLNDLADHSVVILNNISAQQLGKSNLDKIAHFVKDGGGLLMVGSNRAFGLGGYIDTPIEELLPVGLVPPQTTKKRLNVAVELVLDKSRSMAENERIEYAKEAARQVVSNLKDDDYIGIIGFDSAPFIALEIGLLERVRDKAIERIGRLFPSGKTNLLPAMEEARRGLVNVEAGRKHMIILTDGKLPDSGPYYVEFVKQLRLLGITISTVLVGPEGDDGLLKQMGESGGGAFYQTLDPRNLPRIFIADLKVSAGERTAKEDQEYPVREGSGEITSTTIRSFPPLRGYVETRPKRNANLELVIMADDKAEPLLASGTYGKGRSIAFTSDADGRWSTYWARWGRFQNFWSDLIDALRSSADKAGTTTKFDLRTFVEKGALTLDLTLYDEEDRGAPTIDLTLPSGVVRKLQFSRTAPGRFIATLQAATAGKYEARIAAAPRSLTPVAFHLSGELFGEQRGKGFNRSLLEQLAHESGGVVNPSPELLLSQKSERVSAVPLTPWFLLAALVLILIEILRREVWARIQVGAVVRSIPLTQTRIF